MYEWPSFIEINFCVDCSFFTPLEHEIVITIVIFVIQKYLHTIYIDILTS
jgi:hypothetical protein